MNGRALRDKVLKFTEKQKRIIHEKFFMSFTPQQLNDFCMHRNCYNVLKIHWKDSLDYYGDPKLFIMAKPECSDFFWVILNEPNTHDLSNTQFNALLRRCVGYTKIN